jgi:tetratricopeptide (TPR) repeat protein
VARSEPNRLKAGTIADSVARLALWARRAPRGFARVEYHSEFARSEADRRLGVALGDENLPYHQIALPVRSTPSGAMNALLKQLQAREPAVVSITGFATAVPEEAWPEFLGHLTWNRERLAGFNHRQIWWMTPAFVDAFIHLVPDLASWFMVRLAITEELVPPIRESQAVERSRSEGPKYRIEEALRRATSLVERFRRAKDVDSRPDDLLPLAGAAADAILEVEAPNVTRELSNRFLPEAIELVSRPACDGIVSARILISLARLLHSQARITEAAPLIDRALAIAEKSNARDNSIIGRDLHNLAAVLLDAGRLDESEQLMRRALTIVEHDHGPEHPVVARCLNNLAGLLRDTNRLEEAEELCRRALAIDEQSYGPVNSDVAADLNNLAVLLRAGNRLTEAEPLYRRALAIDEQIYGPNHPSVAIDLINYAVLLHSMNRLDDSEALSRRALEIDERSYGADHPIVAVDLINLGSLLQSRNLTAEAEALLRRALTIDEQAYDSNHPKVARDLNNLALLLQTANRRNEAEPLFRRALQILLSAARSNPHLIPQLTSVVHNHRGFLETMGRTPGQIRTRLDEIGKPFGVSLGGSVTAK